MPRVGPETKSAIFAPFHLAGALQGNVFERVSQGTAASIANGTFSVDVNHLVLLYQLQSVGTVFSQFKFGIIVGSSM